MSSQPQHTYAYKPLIQGERIIRRKIAPWQSEVVGDLMELDLQAASSENPIAIACNQLSLLEAFKGNNQNALQLSRLQIEFWKKLAQYRGDNSCLLYALQPWINIKRLTRWQMKNTEALESYTELAPEQHDTASSLQTDFQFPVSLQELFSLDDNNRWQTLVSGCYWIEYTRLLLSMGRYQELMEKLSIGLRESSPEVKLALLDVWFAALCSSEKFDYASKSIAQMKLTEKGPYKQQFQLLNIIIGMNMGRAEAKQDYQDWLGEQTELRGDDSSAPSFTVERGCFLAEAYKITAAFSSHAQKMQLAEHVYLYGKELEDEMLQFEACSQLNQLGAMSDDEMHHKFSDSQYRLINKKVKTSEAGVDRNTDNIMEAMGLMANLQFEDCKQALRQCVHV